MKAINFKKDIIYLLSGLLTKGNKIFQPFLLCWSSQKMKEPFAGVERRKSAAASPTKRIERILLAETGG